MAAVDVDAVVAVAADGVAGVVDADVVAGDASSWASDSSALDRGVALGPHEKLDDSLRLEFVKAVPANMVSFGVAAVVDRAAAVVAAISVGDT